METERAYDASFVVLERPEADPDARYILRIPAPDDRHVLWFTTSEDWPREGRLRCWPLAAPPNGELDLEAADVVHVLESVRRGPCLDLVLDRGVQRTCRFVQGPVELDDRGSAASDEEGVFWQAGTGVVAVAPRQRVPTARERGVVDLEILVDTREQSPWPFEDLPVTLTERKLEAGDYAVADGGEIVAVVERKKTGDFSGSLTRGRMSEQMAVLATFPRAAVVIEGSYPMVLNRKRVTRDRMADLVGAVQASFPNVPIVFSGNRKDAQQWAYRWLAACLSHHRDRSGASLLDPR